MLTKLIAYEKLIYIHIVPLTKKVNRHKLALNIMFIFEIV